MIPYQHKEKGKRQQGSRGARLCTLVLLVTGFSAKLAIGGQEWNWSFHTEAGAFVTNGTLADTQGPFTFTILDFSVIRSQASGTNNAGAIYVVQSPPAEFMWDGTRPTSFSGSDFDGRGPRDTYGFSSNENGELFGDLIAGDGDYVTDEDGRFISGPLTITPSREVSLVRCKAQLGGSYVEAIDPDGENKGIAAIIPDGQAVFQQKEGEGPWAMFVVKNLPLPGGTRLDVCLSNGEESSPDILLQQIFLNDFGDEFPEPGTFGVPSQIALGNAEINERNDSVPMLIPTPDFVTTPLTELSGSVANICEEVVGRYLRVRRSETHSSPCNEEIILQRRVSEDELILR